jgi:hypothetical protein
MKKLFIAAFALALACSLPSAAAEPSAPVASGDQPTGRDADVNKTIRMESRQPMNMDEPMPTGMAKQGMKKGDVKAQAQKKEALMDEMMKQEKMKQ